MNRYKVVPNIDTSMVIEAENENEAIKKVIQMAHEGKIRISTLEETLKMYVEKLFGDKIPKTIPEKTLKLAKTLAMELELAFGLEEAIPAIGYIEAAMQKAQMFLVEKWEKRKEKT